ncbi:plasmid mobilization relaxosome protein MobC [Curvibacter gracilis]|uniref:plasmid mobilization relaxosome protein MobC n=1 Tax=Curvibacter gracilis TaxID=230310 RepID=UPI000A02A3A4|nr:plasmid mobilization relaxosome protein MobC [Curvibacter gracilis]
MLDTEEDKFQEKILRIETRRQNAKNKSVRKKSAGQAGKEDNKLKRNVSIRIRVSPKEYEKITGLYLETNETTLSLFARKKLLSELNSENKQVKLSEENQNLLIIQMLKIGNNLNQMTKRLHNSAISSNELKVNLEEIKNILKEISKDLK